MKIKKTLAMTGQNGASSKLGTKGQKPSLFGREEKKTEASENEMKEQKRCNHDRSTSV